MMHMMFKVAMGPMYETISRPFIMYASETWVPRKCEQDMLGRTEMIMFRCIVGIED